jgi:hypothetical protein
VRCHAAQVQRVVLNGLTAVKCGEVELPTQLLHHHILHAVVVDPHGRNHISGLLGRILLNNHQHHLRWYRAAQGVKCYHILLLIGAAILDDTPESSRLQLHLHQERPVRVIGLDEGRIASSTAYLTNHPLDYKSIFGGGVGLLPHHLHNKD